jgi:hypothetical protein
MGGNDIDIGAPMFRRLSWIGFLCFGAILLPIGTVAAACSEVPLVPSFSATIDKGTFPAIISIDISLDDLRLLKGQLEVFRENDLEGYNDNLRHYLQKTKSLDKTLEIANSKGHCRQEYSILHQSIADELDKCGYEYLLVYKQYLVRYKVFSDIENQSIARCMLSSC